MYVCICIGQLYVLQLIEYATVQLYEVRIWRNYVQETWPKELLKTVKYADTLIDMYIYCNGKTFSGLTIAYADVRENKECVETWQYHGFLGVLARHVL
jgi:hypothetical protein